jgi:hypothetical protein
MLTIAKGVIHGLLEGLADRPDATNPVACVHIRAGEDWSCQDGGHAEMCDGCRVFHGLHQALDALAALEKADEENDENRCAECGQTVQFGDDGQPLPHDTEAGRSCDAGEDGCP